MVAGPIVRAREFIPQLASPRDPRNVAVGAGVVLIAIGLVKKVALADYLAREVVDPVFGVPEAYAAPDVALAAYAYAAQIYCDFSGYTDIAIGVALLMGFVFPQNFNCPYRATSFRDFWRRWHMTLSRFLRDFLYIPLGGNRGGKLQDGAQPDDHDGARRALARRGLGLRAVGDAARRWRSWSSTRCAGGSTAPAWLALADRLQRRGVRLDPVPRRDPRAGRHLHRPALRSGPGDALGARHRGRRRGGDRLPAAAARSARAAARAGRRRCPAPALGLALACVVAVVGATVPSGGVPPFIYFQF